MQFINGADGMLQGADNMFNKYLGDGADPTMAPPGQQTMDAYEVLAGLGEVQITEKTSIIEALTAFAGTDNEFEMPNKYKVLTPDGRQAFFVAEGTDLCTRQAKGCCSDCAAWDVEMRVVNGNNEAEEAFVVKRPWTCTCCCFNRPHASIQDARTGEELAHMQDPYACCDITFKITGRDGEDTMKVKGGCCQWGLCCPLPCGPCQEVHFTAEDANGDEVGHITKRVPSMFKFLAAPDVDNYHVDFGGISDPSMKVALMMVAVFIDFRYFSENENADDEDGDHIPDRFDFSHDSGSDN